MKRMKKMKRMYYICMACLVLLLPSVCAQVATTVNGYPVIDLTALSSFGVTSKRFQVSRSDNSTGSTWDNAKTTICSSTATIDGSTGWRMPTVSELRWIWVLHPQLVGKGGFTAFGGTDYWSSTEYSASYAWFVRFNIGYVLNYTKTETYRLRCVRDI